MAFWQYVPTCSECGTGTSFTAFYVRLDTKPILTWLRPAKRMLEEKQKKDEPCNVGGGICFRV